VMGGKLVFLYPVHFISILKNPSISFRETNMSPHPPPPRRFPANTIREETASPQYDETLPN
jgi:hypothetical protein